MPCRASSPVQDGGQQGTQPGADLDCGRVRAAAVHPPAPVLGAARAKRGWCTPRRGRGRAGAVAGPESCRWCGPSGLMSAPAAVFIPEPSARFPVCLPQVPSAIAIKGRILLPFLPQAGARRCRAEAPGHRTVPGREGAHPWGRQPLSPLGSHHRRSGCPTGFITAGGSSWRGQRLTRLTCRSAGEGVEAPGWRGWGCHTSPELWAGGGGGRHPSPEPPEGCRAGAAWLGKADGAVPLAPRPRWAGPCPLGWGSRSSSSRPDTRLPARGGAGCAVTPALPGSLPAPLHPRGQAGQAGGPARTLLKPPCSAVPQFPHCKSASTAGGG